MNCQYISSIFTESGTMTTVIGNGYKGYMRDINVYPYAEE